MKGFSNGSKILEGPVPDWKKFGQPGAGNGLGGATTGLPRFDTARFKARFPFALIDLEETTLPLRVQLTGWSPFIPTDADNSGLPVAGLEYRFTNTGAKTLEAVFSYNARNFLRVDGGKNKILSHAGGFILSEEGAKEKAA